MRRQILSNTVLSGFAAIASAMVGFILLPFMVKNLGVADYGLYAVCGIFLATGYISIFEFGIGAGLVKTVAELRVLKRDKDVSEVASIFFMWMTGVGVVLAIGLHLLAPWIVGDLLVVSPSKQNVIIQGMTILSWGYVFQFPVIVLQSVIEGIQDYRTLRTQQLLVVLASAIAIVFALTYNVKIVGDSVVLTVLLLQQVCGAAGFLFLLIQVRRRGVRLKLSKFSKKIVAPVLSYAKFTFSGKISSLVYNETDKLLIGVVLGPIAMTQYDLVMRVPRVIKGLLGVGNAVILPTAADLGARSQPHRLRSLFISGVRLNLLFSLPGLAYLFFAAPEFLSAWSSGDFAALAPELRWMLIWCLCSVFYGFGTGVVAGAGRRLKENNWVSWAITMTKVVLSVLLVRQLEILGLVVAQAVSVVIVLPWFFRLIFRELDIRSLHFLRQLVLMIGLSFAPAVFYWFRRYGVMNETASMIELVIFGAVWSFAAGALLYRFSLGVREKAAFWDLMKIVTKRRG